MKDILWSVILLIVVSGCASTIQPTRQAQYLSDKYNSQIQKNIYVFSLIDARADKESDTRELLSNKVMFSEQIFNPLKVRGYAPKLVQIDTSTCGSLVQINNINEMNCLDDNLFDSGDLFLLTSIDQWIPPQGMGVNGHTKVTGVLYSKDENTFIWKDSVEGTYDSLNTAMLGLGGYAGKMILKSMGRDLTFRSNAFGSAKELLKSLPPLPK